MVEIDTGVFRETKESRKTVGNQHGTAYYNNVKQGTASEQFIIAIYYWFHFCANTDAYGAAIDRELFGKSVFIEINTGVVVGRPELTPAFSDFEERLQLPLQFPKTRILTLDKSNWLDPSVTDSIEFVGRKNERAALDSFANSPNSFLIWAVSGPSGAGKTRLVTQWLRDFKAGISAGPDWDAGFLTIQMVRKWQESGGDWVKWLPTRPTFIVIDYIHLFATEIVQLVLHHANLRGNQVKSSKIRLLLIDHIFPEDLDRLFDDPRFLELSSGGFDLDEKRQLFFRARPLLLRHANQDKADIEAVVISAAEIHGRMPDAQELAEALGDLRRTPGAWCPLFAALSGRAIALGVAGKSYDRRDLMRNYLKTSGRLPWTASNPNASRLGFWASCFVAAATAIRGAKIKDLIQCLPDDLRLDRHSRRLITVIARNIVSNEDDDLIFPFEPDILGETFFILLLEEASHVQDLQFDLSRTLAQACAGRTDIADNGILKAGDEFLGFFGRLMRNLGNEGRNLSTLKYWNFVIKFMSPANFQAGYFRQIVSIIRAGVIQALSSSDYILEPLADEEILILFDDLTAATNDESINVDALMSMLSVYDFYRKSCPERTSYIKYIIDALTNAACGAVRFGSREFILLAAIESGYLSAVKMVMKEPYVDPNLVTIDNVSGLYLACQNGNTDIVDLLLDIDDIDVNKGPEDTTPLAAAVSNGHRDVVEQLLKHRHIDINKPNKTGMRPLMWACIGKYIDIFEMLFRCPDIKCDEVNLNGRTALSCAVSANFIEAVRAFSNSDKADFNRKGQLDFTPLHIACGSQNSEMIEIILRHPGIELNSRADQIGGATPLILAANLGNSTSVSIISGDPRCELNLKDNNGHTAVDHIIHLLNTSKTGERYVVEYLRLLETLVANGGVRGTDI
ncbi:hypothetical protein DWF00_07650 [Bosea caraganae]|uniref:Ankyrin repeat domain-containing protein n=2 Tax=Bosea caraganae TaxID=2763117 RepID=A0A370L158_9HYPH|nr:hypothetical protein DWE98_22445 [Bosea caraganae]RDJ28598.1 hypothetical protein DWF00_07650 [Bosea caraganae]